MSKPNVALIGTGLMGFPMSKNILAAGFPLTVWNRTPEKAKGLEKDGARVANTLADAVENADFVIVMVSDGAAVADLLFEQGLAGAMKSGATLIDMGSIKPAEARAHADQLARMSIHQLDAPVSGGTRGAENASLAIMVGGNETVFNAAEPLLQSMGRPVRVGPVGAGQLSKLANQAIVAVTIGVVAEAMLFAEKGGADPAAIRNALKGGFADSVILQQHGERMTTGNFEPGGLSRLQLKDINNVLEEARNNGLTLPLTEQLQERFGRLVNELDGGETDHSGIYLELLDRNGLGSKA